MMVAESFALSDTIILIPARLKATRLPDKPLALIGREPMIVHVWRRAIESGAGRVIVACAETPIADAIAAVGGEAVLTDPDLPSGTDRIRAALASVDPAGRYGRVINLQGDLPTLDPAVLAQVLEPIDVLGTPMATLVCPTEDPHDRADPNVVKAVVSFRPDRPEIGRALYFTRATCPSGDGPVLHHIGIYAFTRDALERFATLPPSPLERRERLEQLRALENDIAIGARVVDTVPFGVDTPYDLDRARAILDV